MSLFAIADLHLSHSVNKPMDIFGVRWENHTNRLLENWQATVKESDTVVIAGDISWGMKTDEAEKDFLFLESLPGKKIIAKGNHDYWWQTMKKLNEFTERLNIKSVSFLFNNAYETDDFIICGSRGWFVETAYLPDDEKIVNRECERIKLSMAAGLALKEKSPQKEILLFLHYPPAFGGIKCERICELLSDYQISRCYYGHIHSVPKERICYRIGNTALFNISADFLKFTPQIIEKLPQ